MAFSLGKEKRAISEINVTPLVDVMLVLLVIFMISTPLMLNNIQLDLPKTKKTLSKSLDNKQLVLSLDQKGNTYINKDQVSADKLIEQIKSRLEKSNNKVVYFRADEALAYGKVAQLITDLKNAGIIQIALVTETEK